MSNGGEKGDGKTRFDLKQVAQWDRQNKSQFEKTQKPAAVHRPKDRLQREITENEESEGVGLKSKYRDRASERRKGLDSRPSIFQDNEDEDDNARKPSKGSTATSTAAEPPKFWEGGHDRFETIKGLDFDLLAQIRASTDSALKDLQSRVGSNGVADGEIGSDGSDSDMDVDEDENEYDTMYNYTSEEFAELRRTKMQTRSKLGLGLRKLLFPESLVEEGEETSKSFLSGVVLLDGHKNSQPSSSRHQSLAHTIARSILLFENPPIASANSGKPASTAAVAPPRTILLSNRTNSLHGNLHNGRSNLMVTKDSLQSSLLEKLQRLDIVTQQQKAKERRQAALQETERNLAPVKGPPGVLKKISLDSIYDDDVVQGKYDFTQGLAPITPAVDVVKKMLLPPLANYVPVVIFSDDESAHDDENAVNKKPFQSDVVTDVGARKESSKDATADFVSLMAATMKAPAVPHSAVSKSDDSCKSLEVVPPTASSAAVPEQAVNSSASSTVTSSNLIPTITFTRLPLRHSATVTLSTGVGAPTNTVVTGISTDHERSKQQLMTLHESILFRSSATAQKPVHVSSSSAGLVGSMKLGANGAAVGANAIAVALHQQKQRQLLQQQQLQIKGSKGGKGGKAGKQVSVDKDGRIHRDIFGVKISSEKGDGDGDTKKRTQGEAFGVANGYNDLSRHLNGDVDEGGDDMLGRDAVLFYGDDSDNDGEDGHRTTLKGSSGGGGGSKRAKTRK